MHAQIKPPSGIGHSPQTHPGEGEGVQEHTLLRQTEPVTSLEQASTAADAADAATDGRYATDSPEAAPDRGDPQRGAKDTVRAIGGRSGEVTVLGLA